MAKASYSSVRIESRMSIHFFYSNNVPSSRLFLISKTMARIIRAVWTVRLSTRHSIVDAAHLRTPTKQGQSDCRFDTPYSIVNAAHLWPIGRQAYQKSSSLLAPLDLSLSRTELTRRRPSLGTDGALRNDMEKAIAIMGEILSLRYRRYRGRK